MTIPVLIYMSAMTMIFATLGFFLVRRLFTAPAFYIALCFYYLVPSALVYFLEIDGLTSDYLGYNVSSALILQAIIYAAFSTFLVLGFYAGKRYNPLRPLIPYYEDNRSDFLMVTGIALLTCGSMAVAGYAFMQGGSILKAMDLIRHEGLLTGFSFVRQFIRLGSVLAAAYLVSLMLRRRHVPHYHGPPVSFIGLLFLINLFCGFMMGGKNFVIYPLITFSITYAVLLTRNPVRNLMLPVLLMICLLIGLQYNRTVNVKGGNFNLEYEAFSGVGLTTLDLNQIYLQEMTDESTTTAEDFYYGFLGVIPRSIWPEKPDQITAGGRFKIEVTDRTDLGAWPPFGFNVWYANFGWVGPLAGGLLSGLFLHAIFSRYRDCYTNPYSMALSVYLVILFLVPGGIDNKIFIKLIKDIVPLFLFLWLSNLRFYPRAIKLPRSGQT